MDAIKFVLVVLIVLSVTATLSLAFAVRKGSRSFPGQLANSTGSQISHAPGFDCAVNPFLYLVKYGKQGVNSSCSLSVTQRSG
jgi:hypothetical protein